MLFIVIVQHRNRRRLEAIAYVDPVTGGDTAGRFRERYYDVVRTDPRNLVLVYANIAKFKSYNDREGKEGGDRLLRSAYDDRAAAARRRVRGTRLRRPFRHSVARA